MPTRLAQFTDIPGCRASHLQENWQRRQQRWQHTEFLPIIVAVDTALSCRVGGGCPKNLQNVNGEGFDPHPYWCLQFDFSGAYFRRDAVMTVQLLSETEVAEQLRVRPCTVRNERVRGRLGFVRIGARIFYTPEQVTEYVEGQKVKNEHGT